MLPSPPSRRCLLFLALLTLPICLLPFLTSDPTPPATGPTASLRLSPTISELPCAACDHQKPAAPDRPLQSPEQSHTPLTLSKVKALTAEARQSGGSVTIPVPDHPALQGRVDLHQLIPGSNLISGEIIHPKPGFFFFSRQSEPGLAGDLVGVIHFEDGSPGYRVEPLGNNGAPVLVQRAADELLCHQGSYGIPEATAPSSDEINLPEDHPANPPIPDYQEGIVPLSSLPGSDACLYLDFNGEKGPHAVWPKGNFDAEHSGLTNTQIYDIWIRVAEDFAIFDLNVTTDLAQFEAAPPTSRQRAIITPSREIIGNSGGVAYVGSFNWSADAPCWCLPYTDTNGAAVISHELGHTLRLLHDGRNGSTYYGGHGGNVATPTSWGPIMGTAYSRSLGQWSQGDYHGATRLEPDTNMIAYDNNRTGYRSDRIGDSLATARILRVDPVNGTVDDKEIIEYSGDKDVYSFKTGGGALNLLVQPVIIGANMDIEAVLFDDTGTPLVTSNPANTIDAPINTVLAAGEYFLQIDGVGFGDPFNDPPTGYTDYGSRGGFKITGTVPTPDAAQLMTLDENTPPGTLVGTVQPKGLHGLNPLEFTVLDGDLYNYFDLDLSSGNLTVASGAVVNFEQVSPNWTEDSELLLAIDIVDTVDPALNEQLLVRVAVNDLNEPPVFGPPPADALITGTPAGYFIGSVTATDEDRFQLTTYSVTPSLYSSYFDVDAQTGALTIAQTLDFSGTVNLEVMAQDSALPPGLASTTVVIEVVAPPPGYLPGSITLLKYEGINGSALADLDAAPAYPECPDQESFLLDFQASPSGDNYGAVLKGWVIPPATGNYIFWIAADDEGELKLSTDDDPANASLIATSPELTGFVDYDEDPLQQSATIPLVAGQAYYIEARLKEESSAANISVAWQRPAKSRELLRGLYLSPWLQNYPPKLSNPTLTLHTDAFQGFPLTQLATHDPDEGDSVGSYAFLSGNEDGWLTIDATGLIRIADNSLTPPGGTNRQVQIEVTDDASPPATGGGTLTINLIAPTALGFNDLHLQHWGGVGGILIADLQSLESYPYAPTANLFIPEIDFGINYGNSYGSRMRCLLTPTVTGTYTLAVAGDDECRLLLGTDHTAASATEVASVPVWSNRTQWYKFPEQTSAPITLNAGQSYYIELLHKEGGGGDHFRVGWIPPGAGGISTIPAAVLSPYNINEAPTATAIPDAAFPHGSAEGQLVGTHSGTDPEAEALTHALLSGDPDALFLIDPLSGDLTLRDDVPIPPGSWTLQLAAQDRGLENLYPLESDPTTTTVVVGFSAWNDWRLHHFGPLFLTEPNTGESDDYDRDGIQNAIEFHLANDDPTLPRSLQERFTPVNLDGQTYHQLRLEKNSLASGLFELQFTNDLTSWTTATPPGNADVLVTESTTLLTIQIRDAAFHEFFVRLGATVDPLP